MVNRENELIQRPVIPSNQIGTSDSANQADLDYQNRLNTVVVEYRPSSVISIQSVSNNLIIGSGDSLNDLTNFLLSLT